MKYKINIIFIFFSIGLSQTSFYGLESWTQVSSVSFAGGGYLLSFRNDFRNPAMLVDSNRVFNIDHIQYPAGITGQSLITNSQINEKYFGLKISRTNYGIFTERNLDNQKTGDYTASDIHFQMVYAQTSKNNKILFGLNTGLFFSQIQSFNAKAIIFSPGIIFKLKDLKLGLLLQNYGKVYNSYITTKESLPNSRVISVAGFIPSTPLEIELDYLSTSRKNIFQISGIININKNIIIKAGSTSNKFDQKIDSSIFNSIFSDFGIGLAYSLDDLIIDFGSYSYGPGGYIFAIGFSSKF